MFKNKKNIVILILSIIILIMLVGIVIVFISNRHPKISIDGSNLSTSELLEMFYQEGYEVKIYTSGTSTAYTNLENSKEGITIQRIYNSYVGNMMTFDDDSINDEMADLIDTSDNDTIGKKQQYEAFENWLKKYNISKLQISKMLDDYYNNNKYNSIDLDKLKNELLK